MKGADMTDQIVEYLEGTKFPEEIGRTIDDSTEAWPMEKVAPEGSPNVLFYVLEVTGKADPLNGNGAPGTATVHITDKKVGSLDMDVTMPFLFSIEGLSVTHDYGDSVDHQNYKPPFPFTGTVKRVTYDLAGDAIQSAEAEMRKAMSNQ